MKNFASIEKFPELVSIIIPAYNVSQFVEHCVLSVLKQDYENIEVIIINDGSTDSTREIIDKLASNDKRIKVFHTVNSGVSSARNLGIKEAYGSYIVFVDGDDYLDSNYITYMMSLIKFGDCDFALSTNCYTKMTDKQVKVDEHRVLNSESAIALLLSPNVVVGCWNKIYKTELIVKNGIEFDTQLFYGEGLTFITEVAKVSKQVSVGNRKLYYYRKNNEDSATTSFDINKFYNGEKALINLKANLGSGSRKVNLMFNYHLCLFRLGALVQLKSYGVDRCYAEDYKRWLSYIRSNALKFILSSELSLYRKLLILSGCVSPFLLAKLDVIRRRRIIKNSVN